MTACEARRSSTGLYPTKAFPVELSLNFISLDIVGYYLSDRSGLTFSEDTGLGQRFSVGEADGRNIADGEDIISVGLQRISIHRNPTSLIGERRFLHHLRRLVGRNTDQKIEWL